MMNPFALFFGFAMLFGAVVFVASPFRLKGQPGKNKGSRSRLEREEHTPAVDAKESVLLALRDLEFDYQAGKVADEDYQTLRASLIREAAGWLEVQENKKDQEIEALIQSRRKDRTARQPVNRDTYCHGCGRPIQPGERFCPKCGVSLVPAASTQPGKEDGRHNRSHSDNDID